MIRNTVYNDIGGYVSWIEELEEDADVVFAEFGEWNKPFNGYAQGILEVFQQCDYMPANWMDSNIVKIKCEKV